MSLIRTLLSLALVFVGTVTFSDTDQGLGPPTFTREHLVSNSLWAVPFETFDEHLMIDPEKAHTELENVAKKIFRGHLLAKEWIPLYFRICRDGTEHFSDIQRVSELEIRMLTTIDSKKHAKYIRQHQVVLERYKKDRTQAPSEKKQVDLQKLRSSKKLRAEAIDKHAAAYEKLLPTDLDAARAELVKYAQVTFGEHGLREEWIALYFRLTRAKKSTMSEMVQVLSLAKQMLEANFPDIAAGAIEQIDTSLKVFKSLSELQGKKQEKAHFQFSLSAFK